MIYVLNRWTMSDWGVYIDSPTDFCYYNPDVIDNGNDNIIE